MRAAGRRGGPVDTGIQTREGIDLPIEVQPPPALLIIISGPSGVGKDATLRRMSERGRPFHFLVTNTTRPRRADEVDGRDYHFVSEEQFQEMLARGEFLEHATVYGYHYGNSRAEVREALARGRDVIMRIDVQGAATIKRIAPEAVFVFLLAPTMAELEHRLRERRSESESELRERLQTAAREMQEIGHFDYYVVNYADRLDEAVDEIEAIIQAEKSRVQPRHIQI